MEIKISSGADFQKILEELAVKLRDAIWGSRLHWLMSKSKTVEFELFTGIPHEPV
jgi:hypothetical protein